MVAKTIEPKELGLAGALQIARVDRQIGAKGQLHKTWLVTSRGCRQLDEAEWLRLERIRPAEPGEELSGGGRFGRRAGAMPGLRCQALNFSSSRLAQARQYVP